MSLFWAFARRDLLVESSYRVAAFFGLLSAGIGLLSTWFLAVAIGPGSPALQAWGGDYFAFAVLGLGVATPLHAAQYGFAGRIREAQLEGTLEPVLVAPVPLARVLVYQAAWRVAFACARSLLFVLAAVVLFGVPIHARGVPVALAGFAMAMAAHLAMGLLSAAFTLVLKRGEPVTWVVETVTVLLGGVMFPVEVLPAPLRALANALPITHALEVVRRALLLGAEPAALAGPLGALAAFVAALGVAAGLAFERALRRAREDGSLTHF